MPKRTKIIATIGPASSSPAVIAKLIRAGMDAARVNFSHGSWDDHTDASGSSGMRRKKQENRSPSSRTCRSEAACRRCTK